MGPKVRQFLTGALTASGGTFTFTVTGLIGLTGQTYGFTVAAVNGVGTGPESVISNDAKG